MALDYKINVFEIAHLPEEAIGYFHSDFKVVVDYFVHKRTNPDYRPTNPESFRHVDELLKMMSVLTHDNRFLEVLNTEGGKPKDMCEVLDRVEEKGKLKVLSSLVKDGILSLAEAAKRANLTIAEFQKRTDELAAEN